MKHQITRIQQAPEGSSIDDKLFMPLSEFFIKDDFDLGSLDKLILEKGLSISHDFISKNTDKVINLLRDFILKFYVIWALDRYSGGNYSFKRSGHSHLRIPYGTLAMDIFGSLHFFDLGNEEIDKIDALWELQSQLGTIPIIFGITFKKDTLLNVQQKRDLISSLYNTHSYFCKVRPAMVDENAGLYKQGHGYYRTILIPNRKFGRVAWSLFNSPYNQEHPQK